MNQFDVFSNPLAQLRSGYPFVVVLQSGLIEYEHGRVCAPLAPGSARVSPGAAGKLIPRVSFEGSDFVLMIPEMAAINPRDLQRSRGSLAAHRQQILAAVDYLFLGF